MKTLKLLIKTSFFNKIYDFMCFYLAILNHGAIDMFSVCSNLQ